MDDAVSSSPALRNRSAGYSHTGCQCITSTVASLRLTHMGSLTHTHLVSSLVDELLPLKVYE